MDNKKLRKLQLTELDIAKEVKRICDKHKINYFLVYGSLLGAVRHKGFIPWDDDVDIGMLRNDYEKFLKIADEELDSKYILKHWFNDKTYHSIAGKIIKRNTLALEASNKKKKTKQGIYIDIFPFDNFIESDKKQRIFLYIMRRMIFVKCKNFPWLESENKINFKRYIKYIPIRIIATFFSLNFLKKKLSKMIQKHKFIYTDKVFDYGAPYQNSFEIRWINDLVELPFENIMFKVPKHYEAFLNKVYGDYMELPPEGDRNGHSFVRVKF